MTKYHHLYRCQYSFQVDIPTGARKKPKGTKEKDTVITAMSTVPLSSFKFSSLRCLLSQFPEQETIKAEAQAETLFYEPEVFVGSCWGAKDEARWLRALAMIARWPFIICSSASMSPRVAGACSKRGGVP